MEKTLQIVSNNDGTNTELVNIKLSQGIGDFMVQFDVSDQQQKSQEQPQNLLRLSEQPPSFQSFNGVNIYSHVDIVQTILRQINAAQEAKFLNILQHLLGIDAKESIRDIIWNTAEKLVHRATLIENLEDSERLLRSAIAHKLTCPKCSWSDDSSTTSTPPTSPEAPAVKIGPPMPGTPPPPEKPGAPSETPMPGAPPPLAMPGAPSVPSMAGCPPPPPVPGAPLTSRSASKTLLPHQYIPTPKTKMKSLNWDKIAPEKIHGKNNVWTLIANSRTTRSMENMDFHQIEELFCLQTAKPNTAKKCDTVDGKAKKDSVKAHLINGKRSLNINIFLKQFKEFNTHEGVVQLIRTGNHKYLGTERLKALLKLLPEAEEIETLKGYEGDYQRLGSAEKFLLSLLEIPGYKLRIESMILKEEFAENMLYLEPSVIAVIEAGNALMDNRIILDILYIVMVAGNFLNSGGYAGNAAGVMISSLTKLTDIRANKPGMNLMHFLAIQIEKYYPDLLNFPSDLSFLENVSNVNLEQIASDIRDLDKQLQKINLQLRLPNIDANIKEQMMEFLQNADNKITQLKEAMGQVDVIRLKLADFFCEEPPKFYLDECFKIFHMFSEKFTQSLKDNEKRQQEEIRALLRQKQKDEKMSKTPKLGISKTSPENCQISIRISTSGGNNLSQPSGDELINYLETSAQEDKKRCKKSRISIAYQCRPDIWNNQCAESRERCVTPEATKENLVAHQKTEAMSITSKHDALEKLRKSKRLSVGFHRRHSLQFDSELASLPEEKCLLPESNKVLRNSRHSKMFLRSTSVADNLRAVPQQMSSTIEVGISSNGSSNSVAIQTKSFPNSSVFTFEQNMSESNQTTDSKFTAQLLRSDSKLEVDPENPEYFKSVAQENTTTQSTEPSEHTPAVTKRPKISLKTVAKLSRIGRRYSSINEDDLHEALRSLKTPTIVPDCIWDAHNERAKSLHDRYFNFDNVIPKAVDENNGQDDLSKPDLAEAPSPIKNSSLKPDECPTIPLNEEENYKSSENQWTLPNCTWELPSPLTRHVEIREKQGQNVDSRDKCEDMDNGTTFSECGGETMKKIAEKSHSMDESGKEKLGILSDCAWSLPQEKIKEFAYQIDIAGKPSVQTSDSVTTEILEARNHVDDVDNSGLFGCRDDSKLLDHESQFSLSDSEPTQVENDQKLSIDRQTPLNDMSKDHCIMSAVTSQLPNNGHIRTDTVRSSEDPPDSQTQDSSDPLDFSNQSNCVFSPENCNTSETNPSNDNIFDSITDQLSAIIADFDLEINHKEPKAIKGGLANETNGIVCESLENDTTSIGPTLQDTAQKRDINTTLMVPNITRELSTRKLPDLNRNSKITEIMPDSNLKVRNIDDCVTENGKSFETQNIQNTHINENSSQIPENPTKNCFQEGDDVSKALNEKDVEFCENFKEQPVGNFKEQCVENSCNFPNGSVDVPSTLPKETIGKKEAKLLLQSSNADSENTTGINGDTYKGRGTELPCGNLSPSDIAISGSNLIERSTKVPGKGSIDVPETLDNFMKTASNTKLTHNADLGKEPQAKHKSQKLPFAKSVVDNLLDTGNKENLQYNQIQGSTMVLPDSSRELDYRGEIAVSRRSADVPGGNLAERGTSEKSSGNYGEKNDSVLKKIMSNEKSDPYDDVFEDLEKVQISNSNKPKKDTTILNVNGSSDTNHFESSQNSPTSRVISPQSKIQNKTSKAETETKVDKPLIVKANKSLSNILFNTKSKTTKSESSATKNEMLENKLKSEAKSSTLKRFSRRLVDTLRLSKSSSTSSAVKPQAKKLQDTSVKMKPESVQNSSMTNNHLPARRTAVANPKTSGLTKQKNLSQRLSDSRTVSKKSTSLTQRSSVSSTASGKSVNDRRNTFRSSRTSSNGSPRVSINSTTLHASFARSASARHLKASGSSNSRRSSLVSSTPKNVNKPLCKTETSKTSASTTHRRSSAGQINFGTTRRSSLVTSGKVGTPNVRLCKSNASNVAGPIRRSSTIPIVSSNTRRSSLVTSGKGNVNVPLCKTKNLSGKSNTTQTSVANKRPSLSGTNKTNPTSPSFKMLNSSKSLEKLTTTRRASTDSSNNTVAKSVPHSSTSSLGKTNSSISQRKLPSSSKSPTDSSRRDTTLQGSTTTTDVKNITSSATENHVASNKLAMPKLQSK